MFRYCTFSYKYVNFRQNFTQYLKGRIKNPPSLGVNHVKVECRGPSVHRCNFHTSRPLGVPPLILGLKLKLVKVGAALAGRFFRGRFAKLTNRQKTFVVGSFTAGVISVSMVYYYNHLSVTPVTNRKRFLAHTPSQIMQLVDAETDKILESCREIILPADNPYYGKIAEIINRLVQYNLDIEEVKSHNWTIFVIQEPEPNASVLPNGYVFVNTGLMEFVQNDDQLAFVLGHEMAHALLSHSAEALSRTQLSEYLLIAAMGFFWSFLGDGVAIVTSWYFDKCADYMIHLPFNRAQETEADVVGLRMTAKACYDIREGTVFWRMMQMVRDLSGEIDFEFLSTHPLSGKRADDINYLLPKYLSLREECKCPQLPKIDPRDKMTQVREEFDNFMSAMKARQNLQRLKKVKGQ